MANKKDNVASIDFDQFAGKKFFVKEEFCSDVLNHVETDDLEFKFIKSSKLMKDLAFDYGDYLVEAGVSEDGSKWDNQNIKPIGEVGRDGDAFAWVLYNSSKNKFFVTTTDRWELEEDYSFAKLEDFLNKFPGK